MVFDDNLVHTDPGRLELACDMLGQELSDSAAQLPSRKVQVEARQGSNAAGWQVVPHNATSSVAIGRRLSLVTVLFKCLLVGWLSLAASAQPLIPARVSSVTDGDTVKLIIGKEFVRVRLDSIDAPEKRQTGGRESRQALRELLPNGSPVQLLSKGQDRYHRTLGQLYLPDGSNVNVLQVKNGQAWVFRRYCKDNAYWLPLELEAQKHHRGLWAQPGAVAPWDFRHPQKTR